MRCCLLPHLLLECRGSLPRVILIWLRAEAADRPLHVTPSLQQRRRGRKGLHAHRYWRYRSEHGAAPTTTIDQLRCVRCNGSAALRQGNTEIWPRATCDADKGQTAPSTAHITWTATRCWITMYTVGCRKAG